jgi:DNA-binding HxlR family transcriptional regulator
MASHGSERTALRGSTADRDRLDRALELIGTRSAMTLLREAFSGARRFDDLVGGAGLSSMAGSARLKEFVSAGLMVKLPYQSPQGTRCEYVLTELGEECLPIVQAMTSFGAAVEAAAMTGDLRAEAERAAPSLLRDAVAH